MKILLVISALVAIAISTDFSTSFEASYFPSTSSVISTDPTLKIVNGFDAERGQFKYLISLQRRSSPCESYSHFCGGSIVAPNWILTAAHCVTNASASNLQVFAGILLLNETVCDKQTLGVSEIIIHEGYPGGTQVATDDIAVLRLAQDLQYTSNVQPIRIPPAGFEASGDAVLAGWGYTHTGGSLSNHLQWMSVPIVEEHECKLILDKYLTVNLFSEELNMCSGIKNGNESACGGDSGGPLAQNDYVLGIVSWGLVPCGALDTPSVYTKVSAFTDWIEEKTNGEVKPQ